MPIVRLNKIVRELEADEQCQVIADDPAFAPDVEAWCRKTGNTLVSCTSNAEKITATIRKESHT